MGLIDKLKNVFFEEVEDEEEEEIPQTFAKKVEIPKRKTSFLKTEKEEKVKEKDIDKIFEEEQEEIQIPYEETKPKEDNTFIEEEEPVVETSKVVPMMYDDDDFQEDGTVYNEPSNEIYYKREERNNEKNLYNTKKEESYTESINSKPSYSYTKTTYYEERETKGFRPSPIISPIYGILDKNYHKEEVVTKRETRISTSYGKPDLDSVRNKAFASVGEEKKETKKEKQEEKKHRESENSKKVYDVNNSKPHVDKVTLADAEEYYNDLGLAYNVDYSDASRNNETRSSKYNNREKRKEKKDVDDNLFDLIDSMYNKED